MQNKRTNEKQQRNNVGVALLGDPKRNNRGITLIALIITIIVILILVAVMIRSSVNSGLFGHAKNATGKWADTQSQEVKLGNDIGDIASKYISGYGNSAIYAKLYKKSNEEEILMLAR